MKSTINGGAVEIRRLPLFFALIAIFQASIPAVWGYQVAGSSSGPPGAYFSELFAEEPLRLQAIGGHAQPGELSRRSGVDGRRYLRHAREGNSPVPWWRRLQPLPATPRPHTGAVAPDNHAGEGEQPGAHWYVLPVTSDDTEVIRLFIGHRATESVQLTWLSVSNTGETEKLSLHRLEGSDGQIERNVRIPERGRYVLLIRLESSAPEELTLRVGVVG